MANVWITNLNWWLECLIKYSCIILHKRILETCESKNKQKENLVCETPKSSFTMCTSAGFQDLCTVIIKAGILRRKRENMIVSQLLRLKWSGICHTLKKNE